MESGKKQVVWGKMDIPEGMLQPYIVNTDLQAMKAACELCRTESCCPEHCCDVSSNGFMCSGTAASAIIVKVAGKIQMLSTDQLQPIAGLSTQKLGRMCMSQLRIPKFLYLLKMRQ